MGAISITETENKTGQHIEDDLTEKPTENVVAKVIMAAQSNKPTQMPQEMSKLIQGSPRTQAPETMLELKPEPAIGINPPAPKPEEIAMAHPISNAHVVPTKPQQVEPKKEEIMTQEASKPEVKIEEPQLDMSKLAALREQNKEKEQMKIVGTRAKSLNLGICGLGHCGGKIASSFAKLGYDAIALNTAQQDLKLLDMNDSAKYLMSGTLGGAGGELSIGRDAAQANSQEILELVNDKLKNSQVNILAISLSGGTGSGGSTVLVDLLASTGKPLVVLAALPGNSESSSAKSNAIETLANLAALTQSQKINNLIVIDNAKVENIFSSLGSFEFYNAANKSIVETLDAFNTLSSMPSNVKSLDPMEWAKIFINGQGLSVYGETLVEDYTEDTSLASAVISNLDSNLLAGGFDLTQSKYVGIIMTASTQTWKAVNSSAVSYAMAMINDKCGTPQGVYKGMYVLEEQIGLKIYSIFSGLGLPEIRVSELKKETQEHAQTIKGKDDKRNLTLQLDTGKSETTSAAQKIKDKISSKNSAFGKMVSGIVDRRK